MTDDAEGEVVDDGLGRVRRPDDAIRGGVAALTGEIEQVPSAVSAIKVDGKRAYARVRAGEDVELAARPVTVTRFDVHATRSYGRCRRPRRDASPAPPAPTCARSRATSARRSASADT